MATFEGPDPLRSRLRAALAAVEAELALLSNTGQLRPRLAELVALLALGVEPEVRACPRCGHIGMREASLCGYCWTRLPPPPPHSADAA